MLTGTSQHDITSTPRSEALDLLISGLDLESRDRDRFRGHPGLGQGRVFGGLVAAQALVAAGMTVPEAHPYSVHVHFLRPGRYRTPIDWQVERLRDGRAHWTRRVLGIQLGKPIATATASFTRPQGGLTHQHDMPAVPAPDALPDWEDLRVKIRGDAAERRPDGPLELRDCYPESAPPRRKTPARRAFWIRPRGRIPDVSLLHAAVLTFASDRGLLSTAGRPHGLLWEQRNGASLDHTVWLHHAARFDGWVLAVNESPIAVNGRALVLGALYNADGSRLVSVAQEGIIRPRSTALGT